MDGMNSEVVTDSERAVAVDGVEALIARGFERWDGWLIDVGFQTSWSSRGFWMGGKNNGVVTAPERAVAVDGVEAHIVQGSKRWDRWLIDGKALNGGAAGW